LYPKDGEHDRSARRRGSETEGPAPDPRRDGPVGGGDVSAFILGTFESAAGWVGHYFELTPAELSRMRGGTRRPCTSASTRYSCASRRR
jgi:hypothetical protein